MCIHHITGLIIDIMDLLCRLVLCGISCSKIRQFCFHIFRNRIRSIFFQSFHQFFCLIAVLACNYIDQTLQIAGNQDIHRWRCCQHKFTVLIISSCLEEIKQYFIFIRCTDQFTNRHTHLFCIVSCKNISKITCRNDNL